MAPLSHANGRNSDSPAALARAMRTGALTLDQGEAVGTPEAACASRHVDRFAWIAGGESPSHIPWRLVLDYARLGVFLSYSVKSFFKKVSEIRRWSSTRYWWLMPELRPGEIRAGAASPYKLPRRRICRLSSIDK